jgi:hypothetical protein
MTERTYRCLNCLEHTLTRPFDVSHLSITCPVCGDFQRFVNEDVHEKFQDFEADPPEHLDWDLLERTEKLMVSEQIVRQGRSIEDFDLDTDDRGAADDADTATDTDSETDTVAGADTDVDTDSSPDSAE